MGQNPAVLDVEAYDRDGFCVLREFVPHAVADHLVDAAGDLARGHAAAGELPAPTFVTPEQNLAHLEAPQPEDAASKVFGVHHLSPFREFATREALLDLVAVLLDDGRPNANLGYYEIVDY